jgi:hypothetical protein
MPPAVHPPLAIRTSARRCRQVRASSSSAHEGLRAASGRPSQRLAKAFSFLSRRKLGCAPVRCSATQSEPSPLPACRIRRLAAGRAAANHAPAAADGGKKKARTRNRAFLVRVVCGPCSCLGCAVCCASGRSLYAPGEIAPEGQASTQVPQSMHVSASMTYLVSPSEIAPVGHSPTQDAHITQSSEIT